MKKLSEMSYEEFGKLRFLDFFPRTKNYREDHEGGLETGIGLACYEGYGIFTCFTSPVDTEWQTVEVTVDFGDECPETEANEFFRQLGLAVYKGMSHAQVKNTFRNAEEDIPTYLRFVVGGNGHYYVDCYIKEREGLFKIWICRKDLAVKQIAKES